ncbi:hypothetical protein F0562_009089 [Nyssa sinensis]|uniref:Uncharacterized protein n=1 Tax=Nyssa sinensis TaxID=561372 RepID=A0A5J4ZXF0_9ASTE|nr:hypothetical protein F0562_009089 [Nyssa sinensis]
MMNISMGDLNPNLILQEHLIWVTPLEAKQRSGGKLKKPSTSTLLHMTASSFACLDLRLLNLDINVAGD